MAIIQTCNFHDIERAFNDFGRSDNFSPAGLRVLFNYLDNLSDDLRQPIELDVVAWCCDYTEDAIDDIIQNYNLEDEVTEMDETEKHEYVLSYLQDNTIVCGETGTTIVYQVF